jgi:hypothetical protein
VTTEASHVERTVFDWRIYAEATCAGLTALVPLPFVDLAFETYFRRRMPGTIARTRQRDLAEGARQKLGRGSGGRLTFDGCLKIPLGVVRYILRKLWRKVVYIFAIADSASLVSAYWHRAYLLDHVISAGHAGAEVDWPRAVGIFDKVLDETDTGPLTGIARQTVSSAHRVLKMLVKARRFGAAEVTASLSEILRSNWVSAEAPLIELARRYNEEYARSLELSPPIASENEGRAEAADVG